jgi:hypothetical protein
LTADLDGMCLRCSFTKCVNWKDNCLCGSCGKWLPLWILWENEKNVFSGPISLIEPQLYMNNFWMTLTKFKFFMSIGNQRWLPPQGKFDIGHYRKMFKIILIWNHKTISKLSHLQNFSMNNKVSDSGSCEPLVLFTYIVDLTTWNSDGFKSSFYFLYNCRKVFFVCL